MPDPGAKHRGGGTTDEASARPVLVIRSAPGALASARGLRALGIAAIPCPVLRAVPFLAPKPAFAEKVRAFALTSPHGARFLAARERAEHAGWFRCPIFAVGAATARAARRAGFAGVVSAEGDATALIALLRRQWPPGSGMIVHAAGNAAGDAVTRHLQEAGLEAAFWPLYSMVRAERLPRAAVLALKGILRSYAEPQSGEPHWPEPTRPGIAAFWSAEAATAFGALVAEAGLAGFLASWTSVSLSPRIDAALASMAAPNLLRTTGIGFARALIAPRPDEPAMRALIRAAIPGLRGPAAQ